MLEQIDQALAAGNRIRGFRTGSGLRVVRIEGTDEKLAGYGEHLHIEDALKLADQDFAAGGRRYSDVYGKIVPHYITGENSASSPLDRHILSGLKFCASANGGKTKLEITDDAYTPIGIFEGATFAAALREFTEMAQRAST